MPFLAIETSSERGSLALIENGTAIAQSIFPEGMEHGREVALRLRELLAGSGLTPRSLAAIAVGVGPGSYTGIRVGVTAAKTLAFALRLPVVAESSLRVMAANAISAGSREKRLVATLLDGRQGFLYGALFEVQEDTVTRIFPDQIGGVPQLLSAFMESAGARAFASVVAIGGGADCFLERRHSSAAEPCRFRRGPRDWDVPQASRLGFLTGSRVDRLKGAAFEPEGVHRLEPAYLRATEAERKLALETKGT